MHANLSQSCAVPCSAEVFGGGGDGAVAVPPRSNVAQSSAQMNRLTSFYNIPSNFPPRLLVLDAAWPPSQVWRRRPTGRRSPAPTSLPPASPSRLIP